MTKLQAIATRFIQEVDVFTVFQEIIDTAISITYADKGTIQLLDDKLDMLKLATAKGFAQPFLDHFASCPLKKDSDGMATPLLYERIIVNDITKSPIFQDSDLQALLREDVHAVQSTPLKNRSGKILGILSTYYQTPHTLEVKDFQLLDLLARLTTDIIERGKLIQERTKLLERLREADRCKDNFLAVLSHELRNPLASIANSMLILSCAAAGSHPAQRAHTTIDRQLKQITRLVDDLLDISCIAQNKISLQRQHIDLNELVCRTIEDYRLFFESQHLVLQVKPANTPVIVYADSARIAQVIGNLLQNAVKFSTSGGMTQVLITTDENNAHALIKVIDDGIGIENNMLEHLFEPYVQAEKTMDRSKGGLGLGLALVKGLIELHGGNVSVCSAGLEQGSEFTVSLPLSNRFNETKKNEPKKTKLIQHCVLIIEDNIDVAESLGMVLELFGHTVHFAYNASDGLQQAKKIKPQVIFCDIGLPNLDGYEVAQQIKNDKDLRSIYLIALSGYAQPEDIEKSRAAGFNLHLAKPANLEMIKQLLLEI